MEKYIGQTYNLYERWRCNSKSCLININGEIGSLRYWANKIKSNHAVLSYRLKKYGVSNLIEWIKKREIKMV